MPELPAARICVQGEWLIIVPYDDFGACVPEDQKLDALISLESRAAVAGLSGTVAVVWRDPFGKMAFNGAPPWHAFLKTIDLEFVNDRLNVRL